MGEEKSPRCTAMHNPGKWPYTARCVRDWPHPEAKDPNFLGKTFHLDSTGNAWEGPTQEEDDAEWDKKEEQ